VQIPGREVVDVVNFHRVRDPSYFPVFRITLSPLRVSCKHVTGGALREMRRERRGRRPLMEREREKEREREIDPKSAQPYLDNVVLDILKGETRVLNVMPAPSAQKTVNHIIMISQHSSVSNKLRKRRTATTTMSHMKRNDDEEHAWITCYHRFYSI